MIAIFAVYILFALYLALKKPTYFVFLYVITTTKFLGFFDTEIFFVFWGYGVALPSLNAVALASSVIRIKSASIPAGMLYVCLLLLFMLVYGIMVPVMFESQSIASSIVASKNFLAIFLFFYLVFRRKEIDCVKLIGFMKILGFVIAASYIVDYFFGIGAPFYSINSYYRAFFPTFISVSLFIYLYEFVDGRIKFPRFSLVASFLLFGLMLARHESLFYSSVFFLCFAYLYLNRARPALYRSIFVVISSVLISVSFIFDFQWTEIVLQKASSIWSGDDAALTSRAVYNEFRWRAIEENPLRGYGFVHHGSDLISRYQIIEGSRFASTLTVVDSGYVDLIVTFGYVISAAYLSSMALIVFRLAFFNSAGSSFRACMAFYLLQYFVVAYTWSVWSYPHGLVPGLTALFLIMSNDRQKEMCRRARCLTDGEFTRLN